MKQAVSALLAVMVSVWASLAAAQSTWVQVEAHPSLNGAQERVRDYSERLKDVNGFRLNSGWYAIVLGPYDEEGAIARLQFLRSRRAIPADAFLTQTTAYTQQFWPIGVNALNAPLIEQPVTGSDVEAAALVDPVLPTEPAAQQVLPDPLTEAETLVEAEPLVAPEPLVEPEPPEETRREALRSEQQLNRQERADLQVALNWFGFYDGAIDASFGRGTRGSMEAWQVSRNHEPTGVLTTTQRAELLQGYRDVLASLGLTLIRDDVAGIEVEIPQAMVAQDRYDPPFAHYSAKDGSGVKVLLISQTGDEASLLGLYDIMQTLEIVPLDGERKRSDNSFTLTGENAQITSYTYAVLTGGTVKGFTLIWPAGDDQRREVTLRAMRDSFAPIDGIVLPGAYGDGTLDQSIDLVSGLQIRRPQKSRSGFYIDGRGHVLTTADAVQNCGRITLDETYDAVVATTDDRLGLALLKPSTPLAPVNFARFMAGIPRLQSEVAVSGYSFEGMLSAPTLTFGTLADVRGLRGEESLKRLALAATPGDAGGPVFDTSGSVLGMLLPTEEIDGKRLPEDVSFAADAIAIAEFLSKAGYSPAASDAVRSLSPEDLTLLAADMTVLVSCWE